MKATTTRPTKEVKTIVGFRPKAMTPLMNAWLKRNPYSDITDLILLSLRRNPELIKLAGKKYKHLVAASVAFFFCLICP